MVCQAPCQLMLYQTSSEASSALCCFLPLVPTAALEISSGYKGDALILPKSKAQVMPTGGTFISKSTSPPAHTAICKKKGDVILSLIVVLDTAPSTRSSSAKQPTEDLLIWLETLLSGYCILKNITTQRSVRQRVFPGYPSVRLPRDGKSQ